MEFISINGVSITYYLLDYLLFSKSQYQKLFLAIFDVDWCHKQGIIFTFVRN